MLHMYAAGTTPNTSMMMDLLMQAPHHKRLATNRTPGCDSTAVETECVQSFNMHIQAK